MSAWIAGVQIATSRAESHGGEVVYRLDVPGDRSDTPELEGPPPGGPFELRVAGALATTSIWSEGALTSADLAASAGADLRVEITDGGDVALPDGELDYSIAVENLGPGPALGIALRVTMPAGVTPTSTGGGSSDGATVTWPPFALTEGELSTRELRIRLDPSFPAGVASIDLAAEVSHDGSGGSDPEPSNDSALDSDTLVAAPDLRLALSDAHDAAQPGDTLVYRAVVANLGTQGATGVAARLRLPVGVQFFSATHGGSLAAAEVIWTPFALEAGESLERAVTVRLPDGLSSSVVELSATAEARDDGANGADLDTSDNEATDIDPIFHAPDLVVSRVSDATMATDPQSLSVTGEILVEISNQGTLVAPGSEVVAFSDLDGDGTWDPDYDALLGSSIHAPLDPGASASLAIAATGTVTFLGDRVFAMADATENVPELDEENNVADDSSGCGVAPSTDPISAGVERHWPPVGASVYRPAAVDSLSTPLAVQLTDDNGDGLWDERDVPDLVFVTTDLAYLLEPQVVLRAIRGDTLAPIFDVDGFFPHPTAPTLLSFSGLAAGDIDRDGRPEIVSTTFGPAAVNYLRAYEHTGSLKWVSQPFHTHPSPTGLSNRDNPTIADLDGDGHTEIIVGANVFDRFGHLLWTGSGGQAFQSSSNSGDRGGAISVVADLDLDGRSEVVAGNTVYRHDGSVSWASPLPDGYPAIGNFDSDPRPEVVVVAAGTVRLHDDDGDLLWGPLPLPGSEPEAGGAPTLGDFDGDGAPEIGVAGSDDYVVLDGNGEILWQASTQDYSSNLTGSTSFDLDGDGELEIVYRDERRLRIYRGSDGVVLFEMPLSSNTWTEEPIVVDVDRDGSAEIVVTSDRAPDVALPPGERTSGLFVIGSGDGWTSARGVWNQHAYTPEHVEEDGSVPASPAWGWLDHNSFRANVPAAGEPGAAPDLTASRILVDLTGLLELAVVARVGNGGRVPVGPGLPVAVYDQDPGEGGGLLRLLSVERRLDPGDFVDLPFSLPLSEVSTGGLTLVADDDGTGAGRVRECDETNNGASVLLDTTALGLWLTLDDGTASVGAGDEVTYSITVQNSFPGAATGIVLSDVLPEHTAPVAISDGGAETGGVVVWPTFSLAAGQAVARTLTLRISPSIPLSVSSLANVASVADDGSQGPDPTPENNTAIDVDQVTSVTADAGGPYSGAEGRALAFDGSGSFDRDGEIVAYDWDLDDDGAFDDASGAQVSWLPPGEGLWPIRLRVTDDSGESDVDGTSANIGNEPPIVVAPPSIAGVEGGPISLSSVRCTDPSDPLDALVDWGDGAVEPVAVVDETPIASHVYDDNGVFTISLCVSDGQDEPACVEIEAAIANAPPAVQERIGFDFDGWVAEELGSGSSTSWDVSVGGATATELLNGEPTLLVGTLDAFGTHEIALRVADSSDDDFIGLAFGLEPGDLGNPSARWYLLDWRRWYQSGATPGLALSEVFGIPNTYELWLHEDQASNGPANGVRELGRATTLGAIGWARHTDYLFRIEHSPTRLAVWVDGSLELDVTGDFPPGRLALYDYSQAQAVFTALESEVALRGFEGEPAALVVPFTDVGRGDTHVAHIQWGDGDSLSVVPSEEEGTGRVVADHTYADDGTPGLVVCVVDDDEDDDCAAIPTRIWNRPPSLSLAVVTSGFLEDPVTLDGTTFIDPGTLDTHEGSVDWGDGTIEPASVMPTTEGGSIDAAHVYTTPGAFPIRVCVEDDDHGVDCEVESVLLVERSLDLSVDLIGDVTGVRPGSSTGFALAVANLGSLLSTGTVLTAELPPHTTLISASDGGVLDQGVVTWSLGTLAPGDGIARRFDIVVDVDAPVGAILSNTATVVDDGSSGPDSNPANNSATAALRVSDGLTPIVELPGPLTAIEGGALTLDSATWNDTAANEQHTGTVDWGDGASGSIQLIPSRGVQGTIAGSHSYVEDGEYPVTVCVRDAQSHVGCATAPATIANAAPELVAPGAVLLHYWQDEQYDQYGDDPRADWVVAADGLSVRQIVNSRPSIFLSPLPAYDTTIEGSIRVGSQGNWDDDYIGFVLGFTPGDTLNPAADYLLIDWKQANQTTARRGLAVSRMTGTPEGGEFWSHAGNLTELARGLTLGNVGWRDGREYRFRFEYSRTRLRLWVDDVLQFDLEGELPDGNFGFYNYSQQDVYYRGFSSGLEVRDEGESFELRVPFVDPGVLDTHVGGVDWDDGVEQGAEARAFAGLGYLSATHSYEDDGDFSIGACVTDDELAGDCDQLPMVVLNLPPTVRTGAVAPAVAGLPWAGALATFDDPGRLDSHVARIEWGDGTASIGTISEDAGAGGVSGSHTWATATVHVVTVCVTDDDGGEGCDSLELPVLGSPPALRAAKTYSATDRDGDGLVEPGDDLRYRIEILNLGPTVATEIVLRDSAPAHTRVVPGSATPELLVRSEEPLIAEIPRIEPGASITVSFSVTIDTPLPIGIAEVVNSGVVESAELPPILTDDPSVPGPADPTRTPVFANSGLTATKTATLIDLDGDGVATPGDEIFWTLAVVDSGNRAAGEVVLVDPIPEHLDLIADSIETNRGEVLALDPILVSLGTLEVGDAASVSFRTRVDFDLPVTEEAVVNQAVLSSDQVDGLPSDDPATPEPLDPTRVPVYVHPTLTVADASAPEGSSGSAPLAFLLELDRPARLPVSVDWVVVGDTATAGEDFLPAAGTATLAPGDLGVVVFVEVFGDLVVEPDESLRLELANPLFARLASTSALGLVLNDDATALQSSDPTTVEGETLAFPIALVAPSAFPVAVSWQTEDGTATSGVDYVAAAGTLHFSPFQTSATVEIATLDDDAHEPDETVLLLLSDPVGAGLPDPEAIGTLLDDDPECTLACVDSFVVPNDAGACGAAVVLPEPEPTGTCGPLVCEPTPGSFLPVGTTQVLCAAASATCRFSVTVVDSEAPSVVVPRVTVGNDPGLCAATVAVGAEASDNCPSPGAVRCDPLEDSSFPVGTTTVACRATDAAGNEGTGSGSVTVEDLEPPALETCPADLEVVAPPGSLSWPVDFPSPTAIDNCPGVAVACVPAAGSSFPIGTTAVACTAGDAVGLDSSCDFDVTVTEIPAVEIPTLSSHTLALFGLLLAAAAGALLRRLRPRRAGGAAGQGEGVATDETAAPR